LTTDETYMAEALRLAGRARGRTSPNPMVGAVVVTRGRVVGRGYHRRAGEPHAEVIALDEAGPRARGGTLYVNLEPCTVKGRTPPCAPLVARSNVARVVVGIEDPNPAVSGRGVKYLRRRGVEVTTGVLSERCTRLNEVFIKHISTGLPFVILKAACTLDGKIATSSGDSKWISCEASRRWVHRLRAEVDAVAAGIGTVVADDPLLTARCGRPARQPARVVIDRNLRISTGARLLDGGEAGPTLVVTSKSAGGAKARELTDCGAEVIHVPRVAGGGIDFAEMLRELGRRDITSILIEGGAEIGSAALESRVVDKVFFFYAPKIVGGNTAPGPVGGKGRDRLGEAIKLGRMSVRRIGEDLMVEAYVEK